MKNPYELAENILGFMPDKNTKIKYSNSFTSIDLYGESAYKEEQDMDSCQYFHLENESGTGTITLYQVFPGIDLVYNDMHMAYCNKNQKPASDVMEINYCREGRCECAFGQHEYCYVAAGDLSFCSLREHYKEHYTIEELSERFEMSPTVLKKCFKDVYGDSIYSYMKKYRLQIAERLLKENKLSIGEIASQVGYLNPNKFTSAFCTEYGMPPTVYRKKKIQEGLNG